MRYFLLSMLLGILITLYPLIENCLKWEAGEYDSEMEDDYIINSSIGGYGSQDDLP
eukprot:CAMPEP_0201282468 /NCGR_PEP_ID=MMETSP1317-20130820/5717_1 /ASSEMBLY_ACC=CAM_ASM_000770 /TAXON_ID=187299 /ORGANISM="Undescribed Undescribed, Strain Undescribed" /LENGTH=55 /DNA_ID=CAMNT_0047595193 /DNA_START=211 /DNA_END=378 /DNA_ORIENTATION=-